MRALFVVSSWAGHYYPLVPLAWAMRAAGHEIQVMCTEVDAAHLTRAGLHPVPVLSGIDMLKQGRISNVLAAYTGNWPYQEPPPHPETCEPIDKETFDLEQVWQTIQQSMSDSAERSCEAARDYVAAWRPNLVVHDLLSCEGPLAAHASGVPSVLHLWGPTGTEDTLESIGGFGSNEMFANMTASAVFAATLGEETVATVDQQLGHVLDPCPPQLSPNTKGIRAPIRYVPYNGAGAVPHELLDQNERKRVCVVWGRSATAVFGQTVNKIREAVTAAVDLGAEVLLLASADDAGSVDLPAGVRTLVETPLHLVLPHCDAVVHYVGAGVMMTAAAIGTPQLMLPLCEQAEQRLSSRIADTGSGLSIRNYEADVGSIRDGLARLLGEPSFAESARALAAEIERMPAPSAVVPQLTELAES
ncbi:protein IroB [Amycolatopsis antarctica]|uniref:Protein IroB n=1 Tax=Amycolatopsis antarctica TaxID=1854586 RepID=A0A263D830_9PSEU|nr:nucleotide disphospho-sugar-binding domain-containing protein [Amycolatopsis antarctica]OZM74158.1 protein IroB [Amycolatopsis antarctica]